MLLLILLFFIYFLFIIINPGPSFLSTSRESHRHQHNAAAVLLPQHPLLLSPPAMRKLFALSHKQTLAFAVTNKTSWRVLPRHKIQMHVPHVITVTVISELLKINSEVLTAYPQQTRITTKETLTALYLWVESWLHWILSIPSKLIIENV